MNFQAANPKTNYQGQPVSRPPPDYSSGTSPRAGYKGPVVHRPQPISDRMKNPLLKEVDDQLRRLKTQFDNFKNDPYLAKTPFGPGEHEVPPTTYQNFKGQVAQSMGTSKPITAPNGGVSAAGITNVNADYKGPSTANQVKKVTQSFQGNRSGLVQANPNEGRAPLNPQQHSRSAVTSLEKQQIPQQPKQAIAPAHQYWPEHKPPVQPREQRPPPKMNQNVGQDRPYPQSQATYTHNQQQQSKNPPPQQHKPVEQQSRVQNQEGSVRLEQKPMQQQKQQQKQQHRQENGRQEVGGKQEQGVGEREGQASEQMKFETVKQPAQKQPVQKQPMGPKPMANVRPNPPPSSQNTQHPVNPQPHQQQPPRPKQQPHPPPQPHKQQPHLLNSPSADSSLLLHQPITTRSDNDPYEVQSQRQPTTPQPAKQKQSCSTYSQHRANHEPPKSQAPARRPIHKPIIDSSSEYQKFESFNSERVRYQEPVGVVVPQQNHNELRDMSPSQKERDLSIKRHEAQKMAEHEERIVTLTKTVNNLSKENTHLKFQLTKLTEQLKSTDRIKAEIQEARRNYQQMAEKHSQQTILYEESLDKLRERDALIKDLQIEIQKLKNTFECEKSQQGFHMALKAQMEQNQRIKSRFQDKDQQITNLRELNKTLRSQADSLRNQIEIERLKKMAEIKNLQSNFDIQNQKYSNDVDSMQKLVNSLDEKFKFMIKEDRKKDEFLVNFLKGKTHDPNDKELVMNFFKQFEEVPKITMSELMKQQRQINEELTKQNQRLRAFIENKRPQQHP